MVTTTTTATASLPSRIAPSPDGRPTRSAVAIPFPCTPPHGPSRIRAPGREVEARLLRAVQGLVEATRIQRDAIADYRHALAQLQRRNGSLLRTLEPLPNALADLRAKASDIGVQARRLERLMDAAIAGQAPDVRPASRNRRDAQR